MKVRILIIAIFIMEMVSCASNVTYNSKDNFIDNYNFEILGKFGLRNKRNIGQAGVLLPIFYNHHKIFYLATFGMLDNKNSKELNVGMGFRTLSREKYINGGYAFFDYRKSPRGNFFKQLTVGYEFFMKCYEARLNFYIPESKEKKLFIPIKDKVVSNYNGNITTFNIDRTNNLYTEKASRGFDVEFGLTGWWNSSIYFAYYRFLHQENRINGIRIRTNFRVLEWLSLQGEVNYDNNRDITPYLGLKINIPFTNKFKRRIYTKMTYIPVRDIDIQTSVKFTSNVHTYFNKIVNGWAPLVDKNDKSRGANVYNNMTQVNNECITVNRKYFDIGTILSTQLFTLMGEFNGEELFVELNSNEIDIFMKMRHRLSTNNKFVLDDAVSNSPLLSTFNKGFWTMRAEYEENIAVIREIEAKLKYRVSDSEIAEALNAGVSRSTLLYSWMYEFRNREDVFVGVFKGSTDENPRSHSIVELSRAVSGSEGKRYIVLSLSMKKHGIGVIVDQADRKILFLESNGLPANDNQKAILNSKFSGYSIVNYTPVIQKEDWSCAAHAYMNVVGYFKGSYSIHDSVTSNKHRHVASIYKRMLLQRKALGV
ncbi:MAG: inverse autotransporter beta domain-containing protein [Legionellales bacterium]|nr:inverse autotransporter beta domain-containing protein [Legionellales bacterium]